MFCFFIELSTQNYCHFLIVDIPKAGEYVNEDHDLDISLESPGARGACNFVL